MTFAVITRKHAAPVPYDPLLPLIQHPYLMWFTYPMWTSILWEYGLSVWCMFIHHHCRRRRRRLCTTLAATLADNTTMSTI